MRWIGLDVHVDFCEVAIHEQGATRRASRVETSEPALRRFGEQLVRTDTVVLEATGGAWSIARLLSEYAAVLVADARPLRALSQAKAKTDRADACSLAELAARGLLTPVWIAADLTRVLRRLLARRDQLVRQRCRAKNEIHAGCTAISCAHRSATSSAAGAGAGSCSFSCRATSSTRSRAASARSTSSTRSSP